MWYYIFPVGSAIGLFLGKKYQSEILRFFRDLGTKVSTLREIKSLVSWRIFIDFIVYKAREHASHFLETGHVTKTNWGGSVLTTVTFFDGPQKYKFAFIKPRGPSKISRVFGTEMSKFLQDLDDKKEEDVTSEIKSYVGSLDHLCPQDLGYAKLDFRIGRDSYQYEYLQKITFHRPKSYSENDVI